MQWEPPESISRDAIVAASQSVLARPDIPFSEREEVFRIEALGLEWDIGFMLYAPKDPSPIPRDPQGRQFVFFLLQGGASDHRAMAPLARLLAGKYGYKLTSMTYPGRLYRPDAS